MLNPSRRRVHRPILTLAMVAVLGCSSGWTVMYSQHESVDWLEPLAWVVAHDAVGLRDPVLALICDGDVRVAVAFRDTVDDVRAHGRLRYGASRPEPVVLLGDGRTYLLPDANVGRLTRHKSLSIEVGEKMAVFRIAGAERAIGRVREGCP